jgi:hypothetical protein
MDIDKNSRTTAIGLARYAKLYIESARVVDEVLGAGEEYALISPIPAYFLITHGLELTLKAYLRHQGLSVEQIMEVGHDLKALHNKACELGLNDLYQLTADDSSAFNLLIELNKNHQLRYIQTGFKTFPSWAIVEPFARRLHEAVSPKVGFKP